MRAPRSRRSGLLSAGCDEEAFRPFSSVLSAAGHGVRWVGCAACGGDRSSGVSAAGGGAHCVVSRVSSRPAEAPRWSRLQALHGWWWGALRVPAGELWTPQIAVPCGSVVFRFLGDGSIQRVPVSRVAVSEADAVVDGRLPVTPLNLLDVLGSWPVYLERGRRGITAAPRVVVSDVGELVDTCSWIDWAQVLDNERVVITTATRPASLLAGPKPRPTCPSSSTPTPGSAPSAVV